MPDTQKWVIANYKETQVEKLYVGQKVIMTVDAFQGKEFEGKITAISGATGSKYSLVPTDNSAGNFVKIQQRVPVRIEFEGISKEDNEKLAAGMMVVVKAQLIRRCPNTCLRIFRSITGCQSHLASPSSSSFSYLS